MRKNLFKHVFFCTLLILLYACSGGSDDSEATLSSQNLITSFMVSDVNGIIDNSNNDVLATIPEGALTSLSPTITISAGATISPASGTPQDFSSPVTYTVTAQDGSTIDYRVVITNTIFSFTIDETTYEVVKEAMSWEDAVALAISRGGILVEINNRPENDAIIFEIVNNAAIDLQGITVPSVWIGANDIETEGTWIFDGDNDGNGFQFWEGTINNGSGISGAFENWGSIAPNENNEDIVDVAIMVLREDGFFLAGEWLDTSTTFNFSAFPLIELN